MAGSLVLLAGMLTIGFWVAKEIEVSVVSNTAASSSLYMDSFVAPLVQDFVLSDRLSEQSQSELDSLVRKSGFGKRIVSVKIWKQGGLVAYSSHAGVIGQIFRPTENLERAWKGEVVAEFNKLQDEADALERAAGLPLLEIYSPLLEAGTGRIIAVAEFYETAISLKQTLFIATLKSWMIVLLVTVSMLGLLFGIVQRGSLTIDRQRKALEDRVSDLSQLLAQNEGLRIRVQTASRRTAEINEHYLRRISADLHDGPAQLLAVAALRLDALKLLAPNIVKTPPNERSDIEIIRESLSGALSEIRDICAGLALPELDEMTPGEIIRKAAEAHERRTRTTVNLDIHSTPTILPKSIKICIYRFIQEALNNAFHHAGGEGQSVICQCDNQMLEVTVSDTGQGIDSAQNSRPRPGLGLPGLRERIESLGGILEIESEPGKGTRLIMNCPIYSEELKNGR